LKTDHESRAPRVAFLTIGQAPRDDIVPVIAAALGGAIEIVEAGALDGLDDSGVATCAPGRSDFVLVTRANGREVLVGKPAVTARLQHIITRLEDGVDVFVILCTGAFPQLRSSRPILEPDRMMKAMVEALSRGGTLGVLLPIEAQREANLAAWGERPIAIAIASPYGNPDELRQAGLALKRAGATLIAMNCMGYTPAMKAALRAATGVPALLPATVAAHFIRESL
jgi:protein AroM